MYLDNATLMRGRVPGIIDVIDGFSEKWDYIEIDEAIIRQKQIWKNEFGFDQDHIVTDEDDEGDSIYGGF